MARPRPKGRFIMSIALRRAFAAGVVLLALAPALALALAALLAVAAPATATEPAPDFRAAALATGDEVALADFRGEVVLLNGWATWCGPCREEMPLLQRLSDDYAGDGLRVVGVSVDRAGADAEVAAFVAEHDISFSILRDPRNGFARGFGARGLPETVLIGRDGTIVHRWRGPLTGDGGDRAAIEAALAGSAPAPAPPVAAIGIPLAFAAGVLSFLSPCVLPLVPTYAAIVGGVGLGELAASGKAAGGTAERARARRAVLINGVLFVAGFGIVFVALGVGASVLGGALAEHRVWIGRAGGVVLALLGLHLLGVLKLPWADRAARLNVANRPAGRVGAFLVGVAFGAGWTPCVGPALAGILTLSAATASVWQGVGLLSAYALGLAVPFLLAAVALDRFVAGSRRLGPWLPRLQRASGVLVLLIAVLLLTDSLSRLAELTARVGL
jgi:cytochrome c-type biogenesis protein